MSDATTFQFASDLHLEFRTSLPSIRRLAPNLILAGDLGNPSRPLYEQLLALVSGMFDNVFVIAGNHEFYGFTLMETLNLISSLCSEFENVHFLHNSTYISPTLPVHVYGGTMWSDVADAERADVEATINDYSRIAGFTVETSRNEHAEFVDLLSAALDEHDDKPFLVISHHLPLKRLVSPLYRSSPVHSAFASDVRLADDPRIAAWVFGHTHTASTGPRFFCNPIGYPRENPRASMDKCFSI